MVAIRRGAAIDHLIILPVSGLKPIRTLELKTTMKFLLAFGLVQAALALTTPDESQTVPENVEIQGEEVRCRRAVITSCRINSLCVSYLAKRTTRLMRNRAAV